MSANANAEHTAKGPAVTFEWRLDPETEEGMVNHVTDALKSTGGAVYLRPRPTGIIELTIPLVIYGVVTGVCLIEQVMDWWRDRKRSGIMIHVAKDGKVDIRPLDIPYGQVIFVGADGKTIQYKNVSQDKMKQLLEAASRNSSPPGGGG